ncbi:MAG: ribonuclease PH [Myxococcales bacterium]|nr:ribonuclease PH [Myxococcales bacterium]
MRFDGRKATELRPVLLARGIADFAEGSCQAQFGRTIVYCTASVEQQTPRWRKAEEGGWITGEYDMLPRANRERKQRGGNRNGRALEISRLIGRSLRAVADLSRMPGLTITLDCDVLQGDGGTRTAAITGSYVALADALAWCRDRGLIKADPLLDSVAAISVGLVNGQALLDLCYEEDSAASADANFVITGQGRLVEVQITGEEATFDEADIQRLLALAKKGTAVLKKLQRQALEMPPLRQGD